MYRKPDFKQLTINLLLAIEKWANDEDGIHPDAWEAYKAGREALGAKATWSDEDAELKFSTSLHGDITKAEGK
jgi:hypothetical protein